MFRAFLLLLTLSACQSIPSLSNITAPITDPAERQHRSAIEIEVKSNYGAVLRDIGQAKGPALESAMEVAQVPPQDRPTRALQLQGDYGLYAANPNLLVNALYTYGRS